MPTRDKRRNAVVSWMSRAVLAAAAMPMSTIVNAQTHVQGDPLAPSGQFSVYQTAAAQAPPMGWNPWNAFHADVDEAKVRAVAKAMVDSGLATRGYRFVNIDDGWALRRLADGRLMIRDNTFPSSATPGSDTGSFKPFTDYIHGLGLKAGIYTDIGRNTCMQRWDADTPNLPVGTVAERQVRSSPTGTSIISRSMPAASPITRARTLR
jgi:alpha-galactosidase